MKSKINKYFFQEFLRYFSIVLFACKKQFSQKIYGDITAIMIIAIYITSSISIFQETFQLLYLVLGLVIATIIALVLRFYFNFTNSQLN